MSSRSCSALSPAAERTHLAVLLIGLAVAGVACPLADAALSRCDEYAADRCADYGPALAVAALKRLDSGARTADPVWSSG